MIQCADLDTKILKSFKLKSLNLNTISLTESLYPKTYSVNIWSSKVPKNFKTQNFWLSHYYIRCRWCSLTGHSRHYRFLLLPKEIKWFIESITFWHKTSDQTVRITCSVGDGTKCNFGWCMESKGLYLFSTRKKKHFLTGFFR